MLLIEVLFTEKYLTLFFSLLNSKNEETILPHECIFVFIWCFIGTLLLEKSCQKWGFEKKYKKADGHIGGLSIEGGPSTY